MPRKSYRPEEIIAAAR